MTRTPGNRPQGSNGLSEAPIPLRFIWTSSASGAIRVLTDDPRLLTLKSRIEEALSHKVHGLAALLAKSETFTHHTVTIGTGEEALPVTVSGTPLRAAHNRFEGYRGFGTVTLPAQITAPPPRMRSANNDSAKRLTETERQAFRDIARALGDRPRRTARPLPESDTVPPQAEPSAMHVPDEAPITTLVDRLPVGILLSRGAVPILMNQTLLEWLDYNSIDDFHTQGGIETMFGGRHPARRSPLDEGAMLIRRRDGDTIALAVQLQTIAWGDLPASLMVFERIVETETVVTPPDSETNEPVTSDEIRAILETATDGVAVLDADGRVLWINRSAEALFGYDSQQVESERFVALLHEDSRTRFTDYLEGLRLPGVESLLNDGRDLIAETRQGGRLPVFVTIGRLGDDVNSKFCVFLRDVSTARRTERDLVEARRAAEIASARKSDFLARISHEIRTPLSAIIGFAEIMQEERFGPLGNRRYKDYLNDILTSGAFVIDIVNDLLDLSKIEAGRTDLEFHEVDVNMIVNESVSLLQEEARRARVILRMSFESQLPALMADKRTLHQIILNLVSNAIKFTPEGGQVILSTARTAEGEIIIRVKDTGIGMTDQELATALEPFRQVSTTRTSGGTGLGLPLTKALVEANRAAFSIKSERNAGTLVEITFPPTRVLTS